jgi:hypothetical protein
MAKPSCASRLATALPMPRDAPVTMAVFLDTFVIIQSPLTNFFLSAGGNSWVPPDKPILDIDKQFRAYTDRAYNTISEEVLLTSPGHSNGCDCVSGLFNSALLLTVIFRL